MDIAASLIFAQYAEHDVKHRTLAPDEAGYIVPHDHVVETGADRRRDAVGVLLHARICHQAEAGRTGRGRERIGVVGPGCATPVPGRVVA